MMKSERCTEDGCLADAAWRITVNEDAPRDLCVPHVVSALEAVPEAMVSWPLWAESAGVPSRKVTAKQALAMLEPIPKAYRWMPEQGTQPDTTDIVVGRTPRERPSLPWDKR